MKELHPLPSQGVLRDELTLAFRYLTLKGMTYRYFSNKYHVSTRTLSKITQGEKRVERNREKYFRMFMMELDLMYSRKHDEKILRIIAEAGRLQVGLPYDPAAWSLVDLSKNE